MLPAPPRYKCPLISTHGSDLPTAGHGIGMTYTSRVCAVALIAGWTFTDDLTIDITKDSAVSLHMGTDDGLPTVCRQEPCFQRLLCLSDRDLFRPVNVVYRHDHGIH